MLFSIPLLLASALIAYGNPVPEPQVAPKPDPTIEWWASYPFAPSKTLPTLILF